MERKHTPLPWEVDGYTIWISHEEQQCCGRWRCEVSDAGEPVGDPQCCGEPDIAELQVEIAHTGSRDDAAFIVRACNSHYDLIEALGEAEQLISGDLTGPEWKRACNAFLKRARAILAKAKGEA